MNSIERLLKACRTLVRDINYLVDDGKLHASAKKHPSYIEAVDAIAAFEEECHNMVNNFLSI